MACADADIVITLFASSDWVHGLALARDLKALTATLIVIGSDAAAYAGIADLAVPLGMADDAAGSADAVLPVQIFAFATAVGRKRNPDAPVNLSKVMIF